MHLPGSYVFLVALGCLPLCSAAQTTSPTSPPTPVKITDTISVTTTRAPLPIGEAARTTYTLDHQTLTDSPAVTLDDALRQHAGFELFRRAPSRIANPTSEGISLRGLGSTAASRSLVLEDGAPLNDPFGGWIHWDENPAQTVQSVELVTGGGSDLYGSSALGGVIDILPASPAQRHLDFAGFGGSEDTTNAQATGAFTSHALDGLLAGETLRTAGYIPTAPAVAGPIDQPANVHSESLRTELGRRDLSPARPDDPARLFFTGNLLNEARGNGTELQTNGTRLWRYLTGYDTPARAGQPTPLAGRARLFGSSEAYRQTFSTINTARTTESLSRLQRVHTQELGATADASYHRGSLAFVSGADVRDIRGEDNETPISGGKPTGLADVTARQRFLGGFGEALAARGPWSGAFSLRADRSSNLSVIQTAATATTQTITAPPDRSEIVLSPRLGLVRDLAGRMTLHASAFRAFRAPTMNELYRTGQVGQEITQANAALQSERATGVEAGATGTALNGHVALSATYFWTVINRPVSAVLISQTATTITNRRENLGQILSTGVEASATVNAGHPLSLALGYQFADATVTKFSAQPTLVGLWIPQVPRQSFTAQIRTARPRLGELTLSARATGRAYDDSSNLYPLAGFFELDLSGRHTLTRHLANGSMDAFFLIQNLTAQRQQVARTPLLTLGTPIFATAGLRFTLGDAHP